MNAEQSLQVLLAPHLSEKTIDQQYTFRVIAHATKPLIKRAVEEQFKVSVQSVRICNTKAKPARFGRMRGMHRGWKKAYVTLALGSHIDMAVGE